MILEFHRGTNYNNYLAIEKASIAFESMINGEFVSTGRMESQLKLK